MRGLQASITSALACFTMAACGSEVTEALPGNPGSVQTALEDDKTIDLNNAAEHNAWDDEMNTRCPVAPNGANGTCKQQFMEGTTLLLKGPVVAVESIGDANIISIAGNNPRGGPLPESMVKDPTLPYFGGVFVCPANVQGCGSTQVGNDVSVVVSVERRPIPNISDPSVGMYVTDIEFL